MTLWKDIVTVRERPKTFISQTLYLIVESRYSPLFQSNCYHCIYLPSFFFWNVWNIIKSVFNRVFAFKSIFAKIEPGKLA